jgi:hypothetical protein
MRLLRPSTSADPNSDASAAAADAPSDADADADDAGMAQPREGADACGLLAWPVGSCREEQRAFLRAVLPHARSLARVARKCSHAHTRAHGQVLTRAASAETDDQRGGDERVPVRRRSPRGAARRASAIAPRRGIPARRGARRRCWRPRRERSASRSTR